MPRKTKEVQSNEIEKNVKKISTKKTTTTKAKSQTSTTKKEPVKKTTTSKTTVKKNSSNKKASTSKTDIAKKTVAPAKAKTTTTKKTTAKKATTKRATVRKTTAKKTSSSVSKSIIKKQQSSFSVEYYDLPFRYNETVVTILAQTPTNLFVYWEISDETRENLKKQYGEYFFHITKPILVVHNITLNYSFEIEINDFANCWYFHINDSNSEYQVELGRRPIPVNYSYIPDYSFEKNGPIEQIQTPYIYISSSNKLDAPNDKILFSKLKKVLFRNIKTGEFFEKDIKDFSFIFKDGSFIDIYKLYSELYKEEINNDNFNLFNPSSGNLSSGSFSSRLM